MKHLLIFSVMIIAVISMTSCGSTTIKSNLKENKDVKARLHMAYKHYSGKWQPYPETVIRYVNPAFNEGDLIILDDMHYIIEEIVDKPALEPVKGIALDYVLARDYQLDLFNDFINVWDGDRYVGRISSFDRSELNKLLLKDNE